MGSTFSELFYFYFQRAKKRKRKQGEEGIVAVVKLFIYFFYVNSFLYSFFKVSFSSHLIHPHLIIQCKASFSSHFISFWVFFS